MDPDERTYFLNSDDNNDVPIQLYMRRWWVLLVFSFTGVLQALIWNTWSPIAESLETLFDWTDGTLAFIVQLHNIVFMVVVIPACMLMDKIGLRLPTIISTFILFVCAGIRCISFDNVVFRITAYVSAILHALASTVPYAGVSLLSAIWFPSYQRSTATATIVFFNYMGLALSAILGPRLVPGPEFQKFNTTNSSSQGFECIHGTNTTSALNSSTPCEIMTMTVSNMEQMKSGLHVFLYIHLAMTCVCFLLSVVYFPDKPPSPPSITAGISRVDFKKALGQLLKNRYLWLISISASFPFGVFDNWIAIIDIVVKPFGISQIDAGNVSFLYNLIGYFSGIMVARMSELYRIKRKCIILIFLFLASLCALWAALMFSDMIPLHLVSFFISGILLGIFINGIVPMFFELCVEVSYPIAEGVTVGFYAALHNVSSSIFMGVAAANLGTYWMTWAGLVTLLVAIPVLALLPEQNKRTNIDDGFSDSVELE